MEYQKLMVLFGQGLAYISIAFVFLLVTKKIADWRTRQIDDDHEIVENSNLAIGLRRTGLFLACAIALAGSLSGEASGFAAGMVSFAVDCLLILVCLFTCRKINDAIMLANIDNDDQAKQQNTAVGTVELGMYLATGFILNGSFSGTDSDPVTGVISALVFFVLGQAALLGIGLLYEMSTGYNIRQEIEEGNPAAGVSLAGILVAYGIVLRASVSGASMGWTQDLISFGLYGIYGLVVLFAFNRCIEWLMLPGGHLDTEVARDRNTAAALLAKAALIALATITAAVM
jgi:uncharacterized membrane protein YjfL (UPF0719 family)